MIRGVPTNGRGRAKRLLSGMSGAAGGMIIVHNTVFSAFPRLTREGPWSALARAVCIQSAAFFA